MGDTRPEAIKSGGKLSVYESERIGVRQIGRFPIASLLPGGWYSLNTIYNIYLTREVPFDLKFILGVLSSRMLQWYWELRFYDQKKTFPKIKKAHLLSIPIPVLDFQNEDDQDQHDLLSSLVDQIMALYTRCEMSNISHDKTALQRQIAAADREIDRLVYELYGLTKEEIDIVEEGTK